LKAKTISPVLGFSKLDCTEPGIKNYNSKLVVPVSSWCPTSLYAWDIGDNFSIKKIDGGVAFLHRIDWGDIDRHIISCSPLVGQKQVDIMLKSCAESKINKLEDTHINDILIAKYPFPDSVTLVKNAGRSEYIYLTDSFIEPSGNRFDNFRYKLRKFESLYDYRFEVSSHPPSEELLAQVNDLYEIWMDFETQGSKTDPKIEKQAIQRLIKASLKKSAFCKGLIYYYLWVNDKLVGFSLNEHVSPNTAVGHFLKLNLNLTGISERMVQLIAQDLANRGVEYLNAEEDMDIKGLRMFKSHLRPAFFNNSYDIMIG
jgi:hypothetical protein